MEKEVMEEKRRILWDDIMNDNPRCTSCEFRVRMAMLDGE